VSDVPYSPVPSVAPDARPPDDYQRIAVKPEQFGASIARGLQQAGQGAENAGKFFGQVAADDVSNQFMTSAMHLAHGDPNKTVTADDGTQKPDTGFFGLEGEAALRARPEFEKQLEDLRQQARGKLTTPEQQYDFDNVSRRYHTNLLEKIGTFSDAQTKAYGTRTNEATYNINKAGVAINAMNQPEADNHTHRMIEAAIKQVNLHGGGTEEKNEARRKAIQDSFKTQLDQIATEHPKFALDLLKGNRQNAGDQYDNMYNSYIARARLQTATGMVDRASASARSGNFAPPVQNAIDSAAQRYGIDPKDMRRTAAIESSGNPNARTGSYNGLFQLSNSEFQKFKPRADASIWNAADNADAAAAKMKAEGDQFAHNFGREPSGFDRELSAKVGDGMRG
jgi:Transglycosylase SLT domain